MPLVYEHVLMNVMQNYTDQSQIPYLTSQSWSLLQVQPYQAIIKFKFKFRIFYEVSHYKGLKELLKRWLYINLKRQD